MRSYSSKISLTKNSRGVYSIDPSIGCASGMAFGKNGCYDDCYAARIARIYGYDFTKTIYRDFENTKHLKSILSAIKKIDLPFIRMGTMGDPSENWEHTIKICELLQSSRQLNLFESDERKEIVIITKHWNVLTDEQMQRIEKLKICINTSISAIDKPESLLLCIEQYERLAKVCKSILRIVSFDFNAENKQGLKYAEIQKNLFSQYVMIDTVFRASKSNRLVTDGIINVHKTRFLGKKTLISKFNKKTYFGHCNNCLEMCGVKMK